MPLLGVLVVAGLAVASVLLGSRVVTPEQVWHALASASGSEVDLIVTGVRIPRALLAVAVGAGLALAGVLMQALTRNPLADPGLLGISAGAGFAVAFGHVVLGLTTYGDSLWLSLVGTAAGTLAVVALAASARGRSGTGGAGGRGVGGGAVGLVLAGVAVAAVLSAATAAVSMLNPRAFSDLSRWSAGSLAGRDLDVAVLTAAAVAAGAVAALCLGRGLRVLALGEDSARALGSRVTAVRLGALLAIVVLCGAATAAAGPVAFVGLVAPQLLRLVIGTDVVRLIRYSLLAGPALVLTADLLARTVVAPAEVAIGVVTAFVGAPVLIALALARGGGPR